MGMFDSFMGSSTKAAEPTKTEPAATAVAEPPKTPLDQFGDLWQHDPNAAAKQQQPLFEGVDSKTLMEAASKANFSSLIPPEVFQAIQQGGDGATAALQQAINLTAQASFAQSTLAATKLVEQAVAKVTKQYDEKLPEIIKRHTATSNFREENPALQHPAAAPLIEAIQIRLQQKHPEASSADLNRMAKDYLTSFADVIKPSTPVVTEEKGTDWSKFFDL